MISNNNFTTMTKIFLISNNPSKTTTIIITITKTFLKNMQIIINSLVILIIFKFKFFHFFEKFDFGREV